MKRFMKCAIGSREVPSGPPVVKRLSHMDFQNNQQSGADAFDVTVIVPTLNRSWELLRAVQSIFPSSKRIQLIIVFDFRNTNYSLCLPLLNEWFSSLGDSSGHKMDILVNSKSSGPASNRNLGMQFAKGEFISFLDDDDEYLPRKIDIQLDYMISESLDFCFTDYITADRLGNVRRVKIRRTYKAWAVEKLTYLDCSMATASVMIRRSKVPPNFNLFSFDGNLQEDLVAWINLAKLGATPVGLRRTLVKINLGSESLTRSFQAVSEVETRFPRKASLSTSFPFALAFPILVQAILGKLGNLLRKLFVCLSFRSNNNHL